MTQRWSRALPLLVLVAVGAGGCSEEPQRRPASRRHEGQQRDLLTATKGRPRTLRIDAMREIIEAQQIEVADDPVYGGQKRYRGLPLKALLDRLETPDPDENPELIFRCTDGYAPSMPLSLARRARGVVAFEDLDAGDPESWIPFQHGKQEVTPEPYYLVWESIASDDLRYKWPYNLEALELVDLHREYGAALPRAPEQRDNFLAFKDHCLQCHSINLVGGSHGPELNTPKNILEYWKEEDLRAFVKNPRSFRAKSAMPANPHLNDKTLDRIVSYLRAMQSQKRGQPSPARNSP